LTDEFMEAVRDGQEFNLRSPKDGSVRGTVDARGLFQKLVETRLATGEPYIIFIDQVNRMMPKHHRDLGLKVSTSNLCSEITLPTGRDHLGNDRTAVCCLSSLNLETWDEWNGDKRFIEDVMRMLDNVLQDYIDRAPPEMARAKYSASRERSVGLGVMGFHSFLQARGLPFEGAMAKSSNLRIFKHIRAQVDQASMLLANERGPCPDAADQGVMERFSCKMAIAPTASISIICGGTSACIEPIPANIYTHKTLSGSFVVKNPHLESLLVDKAKNSDSVWNTILEKGGSVQHLDFLTQDEKDCYKTSFEIDQRWLLELAADRTPYIDQAASLNLFIPADVEKWDLLMLHYRAWELGIKSLYYLRSKSVQRAGFAGGVEADNTPEAAKFELSAESTDYDECLACQ
jgi:ribonucleoside-diphosphate reductase alpha chain